MAEHDGKVVFDLEVDSNRAKSEINKVLNSLKGQRATVTVTADTSAATTNLQRVQSVVHDVNSSSANITVSADIDDAQTDLGTVEGHANAVDDLSPEVTVTADVDAATTNLDTVENRAEDVDALAPEVTVDANISAAEGNLGRVISESNVVDNLAPVVDVDAEISAAQTNLQAVQANAEAVESTDPTVTVSADTDAARTNLQTAQADANAVEGTDPTVTVTAETTAADAALEHTRSLAQDLENSDPTVTVNSSGTSGEVKKGIMQGVGQALGSKLTGIPGMITGGIGDIFQTGLGYQTGRAKAMTLIPQGTNMDAYEQALMGLSLETGASTSNLWEATYQALSASVGFGDSTGGDMINFLRLATQLGTGGFTDSATSADLLSSVYNAYGGKMDYSDIAEMTIKTQNKGKTTVGELGASIANIAPTAGSYGIGYDQIMAMMATITASGKGTAEASTSVRALMNELAKTDTTGEKSMKAALKGTEYDGKSLTEIMAMGGTMEEVLSAIQTYAQKNDKSMVDLFSSQEAAGAVDLLYGTQGLFKSNLQYMRDQSTDVVGEAYGTMSNTTAFTLAQLQAKWAEVQIKLFNSAAPLIDKVLSFLGSDKMGALIDKFTNKITNLIDSDQVEAVIDGLISALEWVVDVLSGDIDIGSAIAQMLGTFVSLLSQAISSAVRGLMVEAGFIQEESPKTSMPLLPGWESAEAVFYEQAQQLYEMKYGGGTSESEGRKSFGGSAIREGSGGAIGSSSSRAGVGNGRGLDGNGKPYDVDYSALEDAAEEMQSGADTMAGSAETAAGSIDGVTSGMEAVDSGLTATASSASSAASNASRASSRLSTAASNISGISTAASSIQTAIYTLAAKISSISVPSGGGTKKAVGLDYVPYDNYPALLHKGEMILTAAQASSYRFGATPGLSGGSGIDASALASAMQGLAVQMDGRTVGRLVERSVSHEQAVRYNRSSRRG